MPNPDLTLNDVRPEVAAFAVAMEERLRANDHKGGWKQESAEFLLGKLIEEVRELVLLFRRSRSEETLLHHALMGIERALAEQSLGEKARKPHWRNHCDHDERAETTHEATDVANLAMMIADVFGALQPERKAQGKEGES